VSFKWVNPLMALGNQRQLNHEDLFDVPKDLDTKMCCGRLWRCWEEERGQWKEDASLLRAIFMAYGWDYVLIGFIKVGKPISPIFIYVNDLFLKATITRR
jgi:hypothetical protein